MDPSNAAIPFTIRQFEIGFSTAHFLTQRGCRRVRHSSNTCRRPDSSGRTIKLILVVLQMSKTARGAMPQAVFDFELLVPKGEFKKILKKNSTVARFIRMFPEGWILCPILK